MKPVLIAVLATATLSAWAQSAGLSPEGTEYPLIGALPGDQVFPQLAVRKDGGYVVWEDNATDEDGEGISAERLDGTLSGWLAPFRVNVQGAGNQEHPRVAILQNGGAIFVWQGGAPSQQNIYARFINPDGTFATGDVRVNSNTGSEKENPALAVLSDGSVVVVWSSDGQDGSMLGVFGQRLSADGAKIGGEFQVNRSTLYDQREPAIAALTNGKFVVVWVSEGPAGVIDNYNETSQPTEPTAGMTVFDVNLYARIFDAAGVPQTDEFQVNSEPLLCASPTVSGTQSGGFAVAWAGRTNQVTVTTPRNVGVAIDLWDVYGRIFDSGNQPCGIEARINTYTAGQQIDPQLASLGGKFLVVWTSNGQDGSGEGIYGRALNSDGTVDGDEFRVNTTTISQQMFPTVASDGESRFLVAWTSFVGGASSFDLYAQRYSGEPALPAPSAPFVSALSSSRLSVTWPMVEGYAIDHYDLYVDSGNAPFVVTNDLWTSGALLPASSHTFSLDYVLQDGRISPRSATSTGRTWGEDTNYDGLPDDWEATYWGPDPSKWPSATADSDGDGASNIQEFLAGTNPTDAKSVLRVKVVAAAQGLRLAWNTEAGSIYQVQKSADLKNWTSYGGPRFAAGATDSVPIGAGDQLSMYRVIRVR